MSGRNKRRFAADEGFTLVELLIAVTLLALLAVVLFGGLRFGTKATAAIDRRVDHAAQLGALYDFMKNEVADAENLVGARRAAPTIFDGYRHALGFTAVPPAYLSPGGFQRLRIYLAPGPRFHRLLVSWRPVQRGFAPAHIAAPQPSVLLDNVETVAFAYYGATGPKEAPAWHMNWSGRALPQLVRLRVTFADGETAPDMIIALRLAAVPGSIP